MARIRLRWTRFGMSGFGGGLIEGGTGEAGFEAVKRDHARQAGQDFDERLAELERSIRLVGADQAVAFQAAEKRVEVGFFRRLNLVESVAEAGPQIIDGEDHGA